MYCSVGVVSLSVRCVMVFGQECCWDAATAGFSIIEKMGNLLDKHRRNISKKRGAWFPELKIPSLTHVCVSIVVFISTSHLGRTFNVLSPPLSPPPLCATRIEFM